MKNAGVAIRSCAAAALAVAVAWGGAARARPEHIQLDLSALNDPEISTRLDVLEQDLDREQTGAQLWQYGWSAFNASSMVYDAVEAANDNDRKDRNTHIVRAVEGLYGTAVVLLRPLPALDGADPVRAMPGETHEQRVARLAAAEDRVRGGAHRAETPYRVLPHVALFGINLLAGLAVWQFADLPHAYRTVLPGILIGEAQLWTLPQAPANDLADYRGRFGGGAQRANWWLSPREGGIEVTVRF